jgi:hypothetical protein
LESLFAYDPDKQPDPLTEQIVIWVAPTKSGFHPILEDWFGKRLLLAYKPRRHATGLKSGQKTFPGVYIVPPQLWDAMMFFRGYYEAIEDLSETSVLSRFAPLDVQLRPIVELVSRGLSQREQVDAFKYWCVFPMWKWISRSELDKKDNDPPKNPFPSWLRGVPFGGRLRKHLRNLMCSESRRSVRFCWTMFQGVKRATAVVPKDFFAKSLIDHMDSLTTEPQPLLDSSRELLRTLGYWVANKTNLRLSWRERQVSGSASIHAKKSDGGGLMELLEKVSSPGPVLGHASTGAVESVVSAPYTGLTMKELYQSVFKTETVTLSDGSGIADPASLWSQTRKHIPSLARVATEEEMGLYVPDWAEIDKIPFIDSSGLPRLIPVIPRDTRLWSEMNVIPLAEPLKVRVITTAESAVTHLGRLVQAPLRDGMFRDTQIFLPTGRPLVPTDFDELFSRSIEFWDILGKRPETILSGDYKAATDSLNIGVTMALFTGIEDHLYAKDMTMSVALSKIFHSNLENIDLEYEFKGLAKLLHEGGPLVPPSIRQKMLDGLIHLEGDDHVTAEMQNGQLMGSILSFPLLCLANLMTFVSAVCEYVDIEFETAIEGSWKYAPLFINGDDILFACPRDFIPIWRKHSASVGFTLSPGKNYVHPSHFTINSRLYTTSLFTPTHTLTPPTTPSPVSELSYTNLGLLLPEDPRFPKEPVPLCDQYNDYIGGCQAPVRGTRRFIHYHIQQVKKTTKNGLFSLFTPNEYVGLGWNAPKDYPWDLTTFQKRLGSQLYHRWSHYAKRLGDSVPVPNLETSDLPTPVTLSRQTAMFEYEWLGEESPEDKDKAELAPRYWRVKKDPNPFKQIEQVVSMRTLGYISVERPGHLDDVLGSAWFWFLKEMPKPDSLRVYPCSTVRDKDSTRPYTIWGKSDLETFLPRTKYVTSRDKDGLTVFKTRRRRDLDIVLKTQETSQEWEDLDRDPTIPNIDIPLGESKVHTILPPPLLLRKLTKPKNQNGPLMGKEELSSFPFRVVTRTLVEGRR